jgi:bifunctional non-homologous end joining protein LigD
MSIKVGRYTIDISNEDKILFPKSGITKGDLIDYYDFIAPVMLPHMKGRPISLQRFPEGIHKEGFFQKDASDYFPDFVTRVSIAKKDRTMVHYVVVDKAATLVYLANQACITPHIWLSRIDALDYPDRLIFDLDPAKNVLFTRIQKVAKKIKEVLDQLSLPVFCMLTGSRGVHIVVPLKKKQSFDETRAFAFDVARLVAHENPALATVNVHKEKRTGHVFIDWLRNGFGATGVAPYAVRALEGAPVATPVTWEELHKRGMKSQYYTIKNIHKRLSVRDDPWKDIQQHAVSLKKARSVLDILIRDAELEVKE